MTSRKHKVAATIAVPSEDPERDEKQPMDIDDVKLPPKPKKDKDLSIEDFALNQRLSELVSKCKDSDFALAKFALDMLKDEIRSATSSMTSVPKPLKYLISHYEGLKQFTASLTIDHIRSEYTDLMSILAMTMEDPHSRLSLKYRLLSKIDIIHEWGAQYIKHLAAEIHIEMDERLLAEEDTSKLSGLIDMNQIMRVVIEIVEYYMKHNSECEACDILLEVERLDMVRKYTHLHNHRRVCEYLRSCAAYLPPPDDLAVYRLCFDLYLDYKNYYHAMRFALKLDDCKLVRQVMRSLVNRPLMKRQCAYLLGWHNYGYEEDEEMSENEEIEYPVKELEGEEWEVEFGEKMKDCDEEEMVEISEIIANMQLSETFHGLARDLDVLDPKDPETDIFKDQLSETTPDAVSARKSLAISYVNAFVNAGYGRDKLMLTGELKNSDEWIAKNKERGQLASVASIGSIMLWDEDASNTVDRYFVSAQSNIRAGAFLAIGMSCSGMRNENGIGLALLQEPALNETGDKTTIERICAALGLGMAYAGQSNYEVYEILGQLVSTDEPEDLSCIAALALGYVYVGTCNEDISNLILADLMEREGEKLNNPLYLLNVLGLSLLFLQRQETVEVTLEAVEVFKDINAKFAKTLAICLECLAYAGTGNVLKIQKMLGIVGEHFEDEDQKTKGEQETSDGTAEDDSEDEEEKDIEDYRYFQSIATLGISIISMGEELGSSMSLRMFNHLIQYGNKRVKRAVPLALAMISVGSPALKISDVLSKLSHDADNDVSRNAILALGLIGSGTNNARIARMLRDLTSYYSKEADHLYIIRIAQGLVHMGKGLLTIKQYHSDRFLMSKVGISSILTVLMSSICPEQFLLGDKHYLLYTLVMAMKPRMLVVLDTELKPLKTTVRVGQALDVVGQAGRPKSITGFQTHETPVLLGYKDRAELASDEYVAIASVLEGFAIVRVNEESDVKRKKRKKRKRKEEKKNKL